MSGSAYQRVLTQYYDTTGFISGSVSYRGSWVDTGSAPVGVPNRDQAVNEAVRAYNANRGRWLRGKNVVWVVLAQDNGLPQNADNNCGFQVEGKDGAGNPYLVGYVDATFDFCGHGPSPRASYTYGAAHEYAGVVTTPYIDTALGWTDHAGTHLPDLCTTLKTGNGPGGEFVHWLWSNGDDRCVDNFTPTFRYQVTGITKPPAEADGTYARGHAYSGGVVTARNTGTMTWLGYGPNPTYLGVTSAGCSPFYDRVAGSGWKGCQRVAIQNGHVLQIEPGEVATFRFTLRPDGTLEDGKTYSQSFNLLTEGVAWMTPSAGSTPTLSRLTMATFDASIVTRRVYAAGPAGSDVTAEVTVRNTGTAPWYPANVVYIGTPPGMTSRYAAANWPNGPGNCRNCRAHRVSKLVAPQATYAFTVTLHIPPGTLPVPEPTQDLEPVADVLRAADNVAVSKYMPFGLFTTHMLVLPKPLGYHEVTGYGVVNGQPDTGVSLSLDAGSVVCLAVAEADAVATAVEQCTITVRGSAGTTTRTLSGAPGSGAVAVLVATGTGYDPAAGDMIEVCWTVAATFADTTVTRRAGCSGGG